MNQFKQYVSLVLFVSTLAVFSSFAVPAMTVAEPVYDGKPLSQWLIEMKFQQMEYYRNLVDDENPKPADAIKKIGTNGIPTLLTILGATDSDKWWVVERLKSRQFRKFFHDPSIPLNDLTDVAVQGLGIVGTNAAPAIPRISKMAEKWETCSAAVQALAELGPDGFAALTNGLKNPNGDVRGVTIWAIGEKAPADSNTIARLMIGCLKDPSSSNRGSAAKYLRGKDPAIAIPALLELLNEDTNFDVIEGASRAIGSYRTTAEVAVPILLSIYTNKVVNPDRDAAQNWGDELMWAIETIDTNAASKAESFLINSGPLNYARLGYTETLLPTREELIAGGGLNVKFLTLSNNILAKSELLDPGSGKWRETGKMNFARYGHTAVLLPNGEVLVSGGYGPAGVGHPPVLSTQELYNPATGTWTVIQKQ